MTENKTWDRYFTNNVQDTVKRTIHKLHHLLTTLLHEKSTIDLLGKLNTEVNVYLEKRRILISYHRIYFCVQCVVCVPYA